MWQVVERRRRRFVGTLVAAAVLMFVGASAIGQIFGDRYGMITLLVVLIGALVFIWRDWRCPACRKGLGSSSGRGCARTAAPGSRRRSRNHLPVTGEAVTAGVTAFRVGCVRQRLAIHVRPPYDFVLYRTFSGERGEGLAVAAEGDQPAVASGQPGDAQPC